MQKWEHRKKTLAAIKTLSIYGEINDGRMGRLDWQEHVRAPTEPSSKHDQLADAIRGSALERLGRTKSLRTVTQITLVRLAGRFFSRRIAVEFWCVSVH